MSNENPTEVGLSAKDPGRRPPAGDESPTGAFDDHLAAGREAMLASNHTLAILHYRSACSQFPHSAQARVLLGIALRRSGRQTQATEAIQHFAQVLQQHPEDSSAALAIAECLAASGEPAMAQNIFAVLHRDHPEHFETAHGLAVSLYQQARFAEAAAQHRQNRDQHPNQAAAWRDLAQAEIAAGNIDRGTATLEEACSRFPNDHATRFALGLAYLRQHQWARGWPLYEYRWQPGESPPAPAQTPTWVGQALTGRHLCIVGEQGFGDILMFCRYLPLVAAEAAQITLIVPPPLVRLLQASFPACQVSSQLGQVTSADYSLPLASLPLRLLERGCIAPPRQIPYLAGPRPAVTKSSAPAPQGLVWRGNTLPGVGTARALSLKHFLALTVNGHKGPWLSLQYQPDSNERLQLAAAGIGDGMNGCHDFLDAAHALEGVSNLISIDTAMAHLGAALGFPVQLLLRPEGDWRWGVDGRGSAWYDGVTPVPLPAP